MGAAGEADPVDRNEVPGAGREEGPWGGQPCASCVEEHSPTPTLRGTRVAAGCGTPEKGQSPGGSSDQSRPRTIIVQMPTDFLSTNRYKKQTYSAFFVCFSN